MIALTACLALLTAATDAGGEIRIGSYSAMTGGSAPMGIAQHNGAVLAAEEINEAGGLLGGQKVVIVDADDASTPEKAVSAVNDLVQNRKVVAVIGPATSEAADATTPLTNKAKVPHVLCIPPGAKVNELFKEFPENYVFRLAAPDAVQAKMMITEAVAVRGKRNFAILAEDSSYGQAGRARLERILENRDIKPVYVKSVRPDQDPMPLVQAAKESGADVLLVYSLGDTAAAIAKSVEKLDWKVDVLGTWTLALPSFMKIAGASAERVIFPQTFIEGETQDPLQLVFIDMYKRRFSAQRVETPPVAAQAYDAVHMLAQAIQQAGNTNGPAVRKALEDLAMTYVGATGEYYKPWTPDDHEAVTPANVAWAKVKGSQIVPVYPPMGDRE